MHTSNKVKSLPAGHVCTKISGKHGIGCLETPLGVGVSAKVLPCTKLPLLLTACLHFHRKAGWKVATAGIFSILQERSMGYEDKDVLRKVTNKRKSTLYSRGVTTILENPHSSYSHELHSRESLSMSQLAFPTSLTFWIRLSGKKKLSKKVLGCMELAGDLCTSSWPRAPGHTENYRGTDGSWWGLQC